MTSLSIYFYAGDFIEAARRYQKGEPQAYPTHDDVMRLADDLGEAGIDLRIYSFVTTQAMKTEVRPGFEIIHLGARAHAAGGVLSRAVAEDPAGQVVVHFPNPELMKAVQRAGKGTMMVFASSWNIRTPREIWRQRRLVRRLNRPEFRWVANHCVTSTEHLADLGVDRRKLIAWDVPHLMHPTDRPAKSAPMGPVFTIFYAGAVTEDKGVGDLIRAVRELRQRGTSVRAVIGGHGELDAMAALAAESGVAEAVDLRGTLSAAEVAAGMATADLVAVPSRHSFPEGFPFTIFEAVASRTPIVASDHPMFRNHLIDDVSASVFRAGDPASLADAVERTLGDAARYERLSARADDTWESMKGPVDWRDMVRHWAVDGDQSRWLHEHALQRS